MSCWVVPSLAAEIWRIPLHEIMQRIKDGLLPVKQEDGFTFVDVAPQGPRIGQPNLPPDKRPATFTIAASDEETPIEDELGPLDPEESTSKPLADGRTAPQR